VILEIATLDIKHAEKIISSMEGYVSHQLNKCIEKQNRYILLVTWQKIENHTVGFRNSSQIVARFALTI